MKTFTTLFLLSVACIGCRTQTVNPGDAELREKLKAVTLSDGVSQSEAEIIAQSYFAKIVGCGAYTGIQDGGDRWIVDGKFGYAGEPIKGFFIDKRSGRVTSPVGPSYDDPLKIFPWAEPLCAAANPAIALRLQSMRPQAGSLSYWVVRL